MISTDSHSLSTAIVFETTSSKANRTHLNNTDEYEYETETPIYLGDVLDFFYASLGLPSLPLLLVVMCTRKYRGYSYSLYLAVLAIVDFSIVLWYTIEKIIRLIPPGDVPSTLIRNTAVCILYHHFLQFTSYLTVWLNVAIAVDRFIVVKFPFKKDSWCSRRNSWIAAIGLIVASNLYPIGVVRTADVYDHYIFGYLCSTLWSLYDWAAVMSLLGHQLVPFSVITVCTVVTVFELYRVRKKRIEMASSQPINKQDKTSRATTALVTINMVSILTEIPRMTYSLYLRYVDDETYYRIATTSQPLILRIILDFIQELPRVANIQNFYVMFLLNSTFRKDVYSLLARRGIETTKE